MRKLNPKWLWFAGFSAVFAALAAHVFWGAWSTDFAPVMPDDAITHPTSAAGVWADYFRNVFTTFKIQPADVLWSGLLVSPYFCQELKYAVALFCAALGLAYFLRGRGLAPLASYGAGLLLGFCGYWCTLFSAGHGGWFIWMTYGIFAFGLADRAVRGNRLRLQASGTRNTSTAPVLSKSPFPVVIENDIYKPSSLYPCNCSDSYIAFNGDIQISETFGPVGDIRIGGAITAKNFYLASGYYSGGRVTRATVRSGASITASKQTLFQDKMASHMVIDAGGSVVFQDGDAAYLGYTAAQSNNVVNGTLTVPSTVTMTYVDSLRIADGAGASGSVIVNGGYIFK